MFITNRYTMIYIPIFVNIVLLLNLAKKLNLRYFYPGFWIKEHKSMGYKQRFRPFEALINEADFFDRTYWKRYD